MIGEKRIKKELKGGKFVKKRNRMKIELNEMGEIFKEEKLEYEIVKIRREIKRKDEVKKWEE